MTDLKLTVVVLCYNHGLWLAKCLDSIISQETSFNFETLVGDDASQDSETISVIERYSRLHPDQLSFVRRPVNIGGTSNYFDMIGRASGEYIAYIDGDDFMLPGKLQQQVEYLDRHPQISMVGHYMIEINGSKTSKSPAAISRCITLSDLLLIGCPFSASSKMFRKSAIRTSTRPSITVDFFMHIDHALSGDIGIIPSYLGVYRKNVGISTNPAFKSLIARANMEALDHAAKNGAPTPLILEARCLMRMRMAVNFIHGGDYASFKAWCNSIPEEEAPYLSKKHRLLQIVSGSKLLTKATIRTYLLLVQILKSIRRCRG